jgi:predicted molibdopterin-dependent oxidoreductase YjgC
MRASGQPAARWRASWEFAVAGLFQRLVERTGADVPFTIDGEPALAKEGDLLITAILLHRQNLRRFEFGAGARAGFCMMAACQDCWVLLADGRRVRACSTPVEPAMAVIVERMNG